jgi:hypothetical protein
MAWPLCHCGRCVGKECSRQRARQGDLYIGSWRPGISDQHLGEIYLPLASENEPEAETGFQKKVSENTGSWGSSGDFKSRVTWFLDARSHSRRKGTKRGARVHPPAPASSLSRCNLHLPTPWQLASHQSPCPVPCLPAAQSIIPVKPFALLIRAALCQNPLTTHHPRVPEPPSAESQAHQSADATVAGLILGIKASGILPNNGSGVKGR